MKPHLRLFLGYTDGTRRCRSHPKEKEKESNCRRSGRMGRAQCTGGRTPDDRGDAARSRAATDRAAGRSRPAVDTPHAHAADLEDMPLADRRSQKRGLLLLRRHLGAGAAVLQLSSRGCICAAATKVAEVRRQGALPAARQPSFNRADACCPCPVLPKRGNSAAAAGA
jgi:hypothetical protein